MSPVPADFGWRYIAWFVWENAIEGLMCLQAVFATLTLDPTLVPRNVFHWMLIANAVLCVVVARLAKRFPSQPPTKDPSP